MATTEARTPSEILAAKGHPGYGDEFAAFVLASAEYRPLHEAVYLALQHWKG